MRAISEHQHARKVLTTLAIERFTQGITQRGARVRRANRFHPREICQGKFRRVIWINFSRFNLTGARQLAHLATQPEGKWYHLEFFRKRWQ